MRFSYHVVLVLICCSPGCKCVDCPGYEFFCQLDLAFLFTATSFLILLGMVFVDLWEFLHGVAILAACCSMYVNLSIAICTSPCSLSFTAGFVVARTNAL